MSHNVGRRACGVAAIPAALALIVALWASAAGAAAGKSLAEVYAAAKQEGAVVIFGPPSTEVRTQITKAFNAAYPGIEVQYTGMMGQQATAKLRAEGRAGVNSADIVMNGASTGTRLLKPAGLLQPILPLLTPETLADKSKWRDGDFLWADPEKTVVLVVAQPGLVVSINTDMVKKSDFRSDKDLLDPRWKGKILSHSPLAPGPGSVGWRRMYELHGTDFIRRLVKDQEVAFSKDLRQIGDALAKNHYPIVLNLAGSVQSVMMEQGVKNIYTYPSNEWGDPVLFTPGFGCLMVVKDPAHPAAAQLFANWLMSRDGGLAYSEGLGSPAVRRDVPVDHVPGYLRLYDDARYMPAFSEEYSNSPDVKKVRELMIGLGLK